MVSDDLERAGSRITVDWCSRAAIADWLGSGAASEVVILSARSIVSAESLSRLIAFDGEAVLALGTRPLAARLTGPLASLVEPEMLMLRSGVTVLEARPDHVVPLDRPSIASGEILRRTGKESDGLVSRCLNRPISRAISGFVLRFDPIRPLHMTVVTAAAGLAMFVALTAGGLEGLALGGLLFQTASILDGVDGEIARATFRTSDAGAALDTTVDMITNLFFVLGLTIGLGRVYGHGYWLIGGADFLLMATGLAIMTVLVRREPGGTSFDLLKQFYGRRCEGGPTSRAFVVLKTMTSRDFFAFAFAVLAMLGLSRLIPWIFGVAAVVWLVLVIGAAVVLLARPSDAIGAEAP